MVYWVVSIDHPEQLTLTLELGASLDAGVEAYPG